MTAITAVLDDLGDLGGGRRPFTVGTDGGGGPALGGGGADV
jgi:hypothetical protein